MKSRRCRYLGLAVLLELVETCRVWPQGLLDAQIAMIPKADGDFYPSGSTAPQCAHGCVQAVGFPSALTSFGVD